MDVLVIMLLIFAGPENPTCKITNRNPEYKNIISRLPNPPGGKDLMPSSLGYQGFMVSHGGYEKPNYIPKFSNIALEKLLLNACPFEFDIGISNKEWLEHALLVQGKL